MPVPLKSVGLALSWLLTLGVPFALPLVGSSIAVAQAPTNQERKAEADRLLKLGTEQFNTSQFETALQTWQQALKLYQELKDRRGEGNALGNLGNAYYSLGNYPKAIEYQEQSLAIARAIKDRLGEGQSLGSLGSAYYSLSNDAKAIAYYQQWLAIAREIKDRKGEGSALNNIGSTLAKQQQPELAIVFYKQSVNVREGIRQDIRTLDRSLQESYTQSVAGTYRQLADLLIAQGRIGEAQQVLERLKLQELNDFTKGTRSSTTIPDVSFNAAETQIKGKHTSLIAFGGKFYDCEQQRCPQYSELKTQYQGLSKEFQAFVEQIKQQLRDGRLTQVDQSTQDFQASAERVVTAHPHSILIYPLVLDDKARLLWDPKAACSAKPLFALWVRKPSITKSLNSKPSSANGATKPNSKQSAKTSTTV
ncbi:tetratricopeptide repeat protein [Stenomitos frigidus]|uniref:Uncharacterized protein n=1 Tax=Stenomitos frigidus ULC18 TaxID=2107698 RepID=A0A2T1ES46_9CYAN|nr:tetratricopeptide repeat protein [Stenomitos frigidus]PSB35580.1 hypothetical protein C7B82_00885 [Stenomitos frigidus ULC18]